MAVTSSLDPVVLSRLKAIVGPSGWRADAAGLAPHISEWRGLYRGNTPLMLMPATVAEVVQIVRTCHEERIGMVPQGGNTGLVGGAVPGLAGPVPQVLVSASRLRAIRELDAANFTLTVEAGCILADVQRHAAEHDRLFPLSLAAEGSCQIGGNISTNAGGTSVLRYGNMRELVLGLEVVLPDGRLYEGLRGLRKDNTGYDLKQLFIGAEGTLGFITAATLKLFPLPRATVTAWLAVPDCESAVRLFGRARSELGDDLVACELMPRLALEMVLAHMPGSSDPLSRPSPWYVLLECASARSDDLARELFSEFLARALESGDVSDGCLAGSSAQRSALWALRHAVSEAQKQAGASIKHDIAVPVSAIPAFMRAADRAVQTAVPGIRIVAFGHLGDGNLHYNLSQPPEMDARAFLARWAELNETVHSIAVYHGGTFSAEHGIGLLKVGELQRLTPAVELAMMQQVKRALDPHGIMNPGKVLAPVAGG